jgi:Flp pilus assembly protein protease CpaA
MAIQDYKTGLISNLLYLPLLFYVRYDVILILIFIIIFKNYHYLEHYIGGADIKIIFIFLGIYAWYDILVWLLLASLLGMIVMLFKRTRQLRFFPCLWLSYLGYLLWL